MADTELIITISEDDAGKVLKAFNKVFLGRNDVGMNRKNWTKYQIIEWMKNIVKNYEISMAKDVAVAAATESIDLIEIN